MGKFSFVKIVFFIIILSLCISSSVFAKEEANIKKKIVFVKDDDGDFFNAVAALFGNLIEKKGYTKENSEYIVLSVEGKEAKIDEVVEKIKEIKPAVVLINNTLIKSIAMKLKSAGIPCVSGGGLEMEDERGKLMFVNSKGNPTTNITGTYTMPRVHLENTFRLLNSVAPIKGKKVVFATQQSAAFTRAKVEKSLKKIGIKLKDYKEFKYLEDYQEFVKKYNTDNEVGWILLGEHITQRKDGIRGSLENTWKWDIENNLKPNVTFWEVSIQNGALCALAIDSMTTVGQMMDLADRIVKGEKVSEVKPEDPKKTLILLNQARAEKIGVKFPPEVISGAYRIYTDFNGNFIGKE